MMTRHINTIVWLLTLLGTCYSASLFGLCNGTETCTTLGQSCRWRFRNCAHGLCQWTMLYNTEACVHDTQCQGLTTCTSGTCSCASETYNSLLKICTTLKEYGQVCTTSSDCYMGRANEPAECSSSVCACKNGYIKDANTNQCRAPYPSEACSSASVAPSCDSPRSVDSGIVLATCSSSSCMCPPDSTAKTYADTENLGYKACFTDVTMLADGAVCMTHNQCNSGYCKACPATTNLNTTCVTAVGVAGAWNQSTWTTQPPASILPRMPVIGLMTIVSMVTVTMTLVL